MMAQSVTIIITLSRLKRRMLRASKSFCGSSGFKCILMPALHFARGLAVGRVFISLATREFIDAPRVP